MSMHIEDAVVTAATDEACAHISRYTHVVYPTARGLIRDEKTGEIREMNAEELQATREHFEPILARSVEPQA